MNEKFFSNKYQVKREIACGGMGTIYLATDTKLGRDVAIKMLHPQYSGEPAFAQRFLREAWAMAKLDHSNIIRIWSVEEEESSHCIVMEYFPGEDLKQIIRNRGPLPLQEGLFLVTQIIQGLAYAHYMGIIHRDIKPANILVDQQGKVKITDFGIAAAFSESSLTVDGTVMGTPEYMAPEQARAEAVGPHTDLYSAGILLYELVTGQTPYKGIPAQTLVAKLAFGAENPALTFPSTIPVEIQNLIRKMTQQRVEDRLTDINEILAITKSENFTFTPSDPDSEETAIFSPEIPFPTNKESVTQVATKDQPLASTQTTNVAPGPAGPASPPPQTEHQGTSPPPPPPDTPAPSHTRTVLLSAIGILTISILAVLIISQWPVQEGQPPQVEKDHNSPTLAVPHEAFSTAMANMEQATQTITKTQSQMDQDFQSLSSTLHTWQENIENTKIPAPYSKAQDWLGKTQKEVAELRNNQNTFVEAHTQSLTASKEVVTVSRRHGETLRKEGLSPEQDEQLEEKISGLEKTQRLSETAFATHQQDLQTQLARLEDRVNQAKQIIQAKKSTPAKPPKPTTPTSTTTTRFANLKTEIQALDREIKDMVKSFEAATQEFTTHLTTIQSEIKPIQNNLTIDPNSDEKLSALKENLRTIQEKAQTVFSRETSRQQKLRQALQTKTTDFQEFSEPQLDSSQKSDFKKLDAILKESTNSLTTFPPDSWDALQTQSLTIQALILTTKSMITENTEVQREKALRLAEEEKKQKIQKATEAARQKEAEQLRLAAEEAQRQQALAQEEQKRRAKAAESARLAKAAQEAKQKEAAQRAEHERLAAEKAQRQQTLAQEEQKRRAEADQNNQMVQTMEALKKILDDFSAAYERRDLLHLTLTTAMSESRRRNLDLMFKNYRTIETHTKIISTSETQAIAKVFIDKLINQKGESITPNFIIRETTITIPQKNGEWGKIEW
ncbi:MAG: protein kinase [Nitrospirota bacterium]|nr:protein kinase [Nitrospirota bacterium]